MLELLTRPKREPEYPGPPVTVGLLWPNELEFSFDWYERIPLRDEELSWDIGSECVLGGVILVDEEGLIAHQWLVKPFKMGEGDRLTLRIGSTEKSGWVLRKEG